MVVVVRSFCSCLALACVLVRPLHSTCAADTWLRVPQGDMNGDGGTGMGLLSWWT
jgi:hypothetical protein